MALGFAHATRRVRTQCDDRYKHAHSARVYAPSCARCHPLARKSQGDCRPDGERRTDHAGPRSHATDATSPRRLFALEE